MTTTAVEASYRPGELSVAIRGVSQQAIYQTRRMLPFTSLAGAPHLLEFFELMLTLYTADRLVPRSAHSWTRKFEITFPVWRTNLWCESADILRELIWRCTGDDVVLHPVQREPHASSGATCALSLEHEQQTPVALLSDGLDSLCGAFSALESNTGRIAFVSIVTKARRATRIQTVREYLQGRYGERALFYSVQLCLSKAPRKQERTQRSRTMLAIVAGMTVAAAYGSSAVSVYENGMGILNMPFGAIQTRHESSQVLFPGNLELWSQVSSRLLGPKRLAYPNRYRTKAQMLHDIPADARALIASTSSCDAPQRKDKYDDCGVCGSCVVRRLSLRNAGLSRFDTHYTKLPPEAKPFDPLGVLELQAERLRDALQSSDPWSAIVRSQPTLRTAVEGADVNARAHSIRATLELLRRHVDEIAVSKEMLRVG